ncbi:MAG: tetratricopeptide repeat protein [Bacteroidota bacterium]
MKLLLTVLSLGVIFVSKAQNSLYFTESDQLYRDGLELFDRADYAAARNSFEKFIKQNSNNVKETDAKYYVALCALGLYHEDGEKLVENFIAQNPNHPKAILAYYELGNFHFKEKKFTKAIKYFEKVDLSLVTKEQRDETRYKLGYAHFSKRQFTEAQKYFSVLKREKSAYSDASSYYSGYIAYEEGKYDQAIVDLRRAEKNKAYAPVVPGMIANLYYKQGRYDELIEYSTKAARTSNKAKQKNFYLLTADAYLYKENYSKASEYYDLYAEQTKSINSDIRYRIGYAKYRLGSNEEAIDNLKRVASNRDSLGIYASYYLGILYLKEGNKLYALTAFEKSKDNKIDSKVREEGAYQYAKLSYDLNKTEQAINAFNYFLTEYDGSNYVDEVNDLLSEAYLNTNNYDLAIKHIEGQKNISRSLQNVYQKATYLRGTELFNDEKYEKAVDHFQKSLKYSNDLDYSSKARLWTAEAYSIGRKYEDAIGFYQQLIGNTSVRNTPIGVKARYGLGYAYYNTNQYDRALIQFKEYTNQLENASDKQYYNDALIRLADCYYVSKQYNNAVNFYQRAINSSKADTDYAHFQIATILGIDGKVSEANSEYDLIVKNYPRSRYVDDAMFYKAQLNFENGEYNAAISNFSELIRKKGSSRFVPYAYLSRASSYSNLKEYDKAVEDYNTILDKYLSHSVAGEALLPLQEVLNVQNKSSEFDAYLSEYRKANPNKKGLESVEFETAKNQFFSGEYDKTINSFSQYISSYPSNAKVEEAKYYMAEIY